jgi:hypothetical protein
MISRRKDENPLEGEAKDSEDEDEANYNISHEASVNISDDNESVHEMKKITTIPILKNNDKFSNKLGTEA